MIAVIATVRVKTDQRARFLEFLEDDVEGSLREEPGCVRFDVLEDDSTAGCFHIYEVYSGPEAYAAHVEAPYYKRFFAEAGDTLDGPPEVRMTKAVFPREASRWAKR